MLFLDSTPDLTDLELEIYKYISDHLKQTTYMRIRELSKETHVSVATIQRFCLKFDCSGFSEFRIRLKLFLQEMKSERTKVLTPVDSSVYVDFLNRTDGTNFQEKINEAIQSLNEKEIILFIGVGSSNIIAEYGALYFSSLFKMAFRIEDPVTNPITYLSKDFLDKACIIALSVSGETPEVINYLSNFNFKDSSIISITNSSQSTVAKLSTVNIPYYITKESSNEQDVTSQLPALFIIEYLAKSIHHTRNAK
ncbi:MurR/RpiR family transcriptional regulator [Listeria welshimeri]|nr:MurR/RpiR family transcriptional regulator [Listeria welshimeri]MBC2358672.1 MurR/RpiR family transcriptional regulator [Listeria welshimeri]